MVFAAGLCLKVKGPVRPIRVEACRSRVADVHIRSGGYVDAVDEDHRLSLDGSEMATCVVAAAAVAVLRADSALYRRG